jgi:hypothetical protein
MQMKLDKGIQDIQQTSVFAIEQIHIHTLILKCKLAEGLQQLTVDPQTRLAH